MKCLHFIRHAKSCWDNISLEDYQRPLAQRGISGAKLMAEPIWQAGCPFDLSLDNDASLSAIFVSPAVRALQTIDLMEQQLMLLGVLANPLIKQIDDALYTFDSHSLLTWCRGLDARSAPLNEVIIFGHNPAFESLIEYLTGRSLMKFPTCAYAQLETELDTWQLLDRDTFQLNCLLTPKTIRN